MVSVMKLDKKFEILSEYLKSLGSVAIAFSGGVDSTFLLKAAHDALGDGAVAITVDSCLFPKRESAEAESFCEREGIRHIVLKENPLAIEGFSENPENRCYICKKAMFTRLTEKAKSLGIKNVAEGSNVDDDGDYRPGLAAVAELGIKSPLRRARLTKDEIRVLSERLGLDTWDKPSFACLASRFAYGDRITPEGLKMVDMAEEYLRGLGFSQFRVRAHGGMARIEVLPSELRKLFDAREQVYDYLKSLGFIYVTIDLGGYRTGSMNETIKR